MDTVAVDAIDLLTAQAAQGQDVWDMVLAEAERHVDNESTSKFAIGDLALLIEKRYGENRIEQFATQVRKSVKTVQERRTVCRAFQKSVRADFLELNKILTYSHFRRAIPIVREQGLEAALAFLEQASANEWTCEQTTVYRNELLGKVNPPARKIWRVPALRVDQSGTVALTMQAGSFDAANIGRFVAEHQQDRDFAMTLTVTYTREKPKSA